MVLQCLKDLKLKEWQQPQNKPEILITKWPKIKLKQEQLA